ncbi:MAG: Stp1/IreP family PP2C-type Ser/Thr phosphatase [Oscillospiraceae bacterium]|nr:Stp1/IreP family PP2C-type Ser/Thr phosphatase [Oscillospiraceae bacterium]
MKAWGLTDTGKVRQQNQDAYYFHVNGEEALILVCDGMGGAKAGNIASRMAAETFVSVVEQTDGQPAERLNSGLEAANRAVFRTAIENSDCFGMGTTLVAALVCGRLAHVVNVGDSRAYHIKETGIRQVTRDHSVVEDMVARGDITPEQARQHPRKNLITRALGAEPQVRGDLFELDMEQGDAILLCSDGLSNQLSDQEMLYEVLHGGPHESCCRRLVDIVLSRGAPDNTTAVLLSMETE